MRVTGIVKELDTLQRPFAGRNEYQVMQAVTQGEVPSFGPQPKNEHSTIRDMLEKICRQCWTSDPVLRPTMGDIIGHLRSETCHFQQDQSSERLVYDDEISNLGKAP